MNRKKMIAVNLTDKEFCAVEEYAAHMTAERAEEDRIKKISPSRRRRSVSFSTAARHLILKGLAVERKRRNKIEHE